MGTATALTLGQPRGTLLIGRPLDVTVPVTLDGPASEGACGSADLAYGETPVIAKPDVRWVPGPSGRDGTLRIVSPALIDEPSVTLTVRAGCGANQMSRRYVLLPDVPRTAESAVATPVQRPAAPPAAVLPTVPGQAAAAAPSPARPAATPPARSVAPRPRPEGARPPAPAAEAVARPARGDSRRPARAPAREPGEPVSRLRLAPLELGPERDAVLHFSTELTLPAAGDPDKRAAAAALWQALNRSPEEVMQDGLKLRALDGEIQSLRKATQQNAAAVASMREEVEKARASRDDASILAWVLAALLALLGGWTGWRWYQSNRLAAAGRWFEGHAPDAGETAVPEPSRPLDAVTTGTGLATVALPAAAAGVSAATPVASRPQAASARPPVSGWGSADFQASQGGTPRLVGVQELLDVHDKADFFLSIGQHDQAIAVLEAHVHDQVETSALPWLDLLGLYHAQGRRREYEERRDEFRQRFTAQVPDFDHFDQPTGSLENYGRALSRIEALWPSRRVLEVIEESIFRKPGLHGGDTFSLEAYRELVLLYHIAQEVATDVVPARSSDAATGFSSTAMQSLGELDRPEPPRPALELDLDVPLDLGDLPPVPQGPAAAPAVVDASFDWGEAPVADLHEVLTPGRDPLFIPPASPRLGLDIDLNEMEASPPPADFLPSRNLPPLDFDTSEFDPDPQGIRTSRRG